MTKQNLQKFLDQETKYSKWYLNIIENAKSQNRKKLKRDNPNYVYYENHHILPASIFPEFKKLKDNPWNGVLLTAKEHFICHALIWKHYKKLNMKEQYSMGRAFNKMRFGDRNQQRYNSKLYEYCKVVIKFDEESNRKKSRPGKLNGMYGKKQEQVICPHCKIIGDKPNMFRWHFDNCKLVCNNTYTHSKETKEKLKGYTIMIDSKGNKIRMLLSDSRINSIEYSHINKGKKHSKEFKDNRSKKYKNTLIAYDKDGKSIRVHKNDIRLKSGELIAQVFIKVTCPHCSKEGGQSIMKRWHFDNCKFK